MLTPSRRRVIRQRLMQALPVLVLATFVVFGLLKLMPGDIAITLAGENATEERIHEIRELYGLNQPFLVQYGQWLFNAVQGHLGRSLASGEEVVTSIARSFPNTLLIVAMAISIALLVGVPLGILAASRPDSLVDRAVTAIASLGIAVPNFWLAMILVSWLALEFWWFPATGSHPFGDDPLKAIQHATLPAVALASGGISEVSRQLRSSLVESLSSQQVRTLHAKGLTPAAILWKHGLKNVGVNLLTVTTLLFNRMLAATVVVEAVFAIPGMGNLIVNGALTRDLPVVQGVVFVMVLVVIAVNLAADILYTVLDPRID
ncbi:MAG: ABC transporter permease [Gammaproteobacteria bacterium]